jgi:aspartate aminotransferase-like enzyme
MPRADLDVPTRLLACGGPGTPDARVLRTFATPLIGQFDPDFTAIMDQVMHLARAVLLTRNARCFPVSGLRSAGLEAVLNTLLVEGDRVCMLDGVAVDVARRCGGVLVDTVAQARVVVARSGNRDLAALAAECHAGAALLVLDASPTAGGAELRVDEWGIDVCVAATDVCLGGPSGLTLVTYAEAVEERMHARHLPPPTHYLDLLQLQAYWSPERLNHHTAPTSLVYALHTALHLVLAEGLEERWARHADAAARLGTGLTELGLSWRRDGLTYLVEAPEAVREAPGQLLNTFGIQIAAPDEATWRIGLVGAQATPQAVVRVVAGLEHVLGRSSHALAAALGGSQ